MTSSPKNQCLTWIRLSILHSAPLKKQDNLKWPVCDSPADRQEVRIGGHCPVSPGCRLVAPFPRQCQVIFTKMLWQSVRGFLFSVFIKAGCFTSSLVSICHQGSSGVEADSIWLTVVKKASGFPLNNQLPCNPARLCFSKNDKAKIGD